MDVTVVLFPLWVLQFLVIHSTISFEKSSVNRSWLSDGLAFTKLDRLDFQFVMPRLKYIKSGKTKSWNRRDLDEANQRSEASSIKVEITFTAFQRKFTLDLYQNRGLFTSHYTEKEERFNEGANYCFYHGTVTGSERSKVSLSTCDGIEGLIYDGHISYYIEPNRDLSDSQIHLYYRIKDLNFSEFDLTEQSLEKDDLEVINSQLQLYNSSSRFKAHKRVRRDVFTETKYVEIVVINDHKQFEASGKNLTKTNLRAKQIVNMVDAMFKPLNVRVTLVAIETWDVADMVKADEDADTYLSNLIKYRKRELREKHPNDVALLLTGVKLKDSVRGKAQVMSICSRKSAGVIRDYNINAAFTANTFAHELGHIFGMYHDEYLPHCVCGATNSLGGCVMSARVGPEPATIFSNCSVKGLNEGLSRGLGTCLFNVPDTLFGGPVCGDGILAPGEECDCGTAQECLEKGDTCCDHVTCKLNAHAQCANGACCEDCKFKKSGAICREKVNECDIPETCTGSSGICSEDLYVHNGYPCAKNTAYCFLGECQTHEKQCRDLWGSDTLPGPDKCYRYHNTRADKFGHCRKTRRGKYRPCKLQDAKCGKLWCLATGQRPVIGIQRDVLSSFWPLGNETITCKGTSLKMGRDVPEAAMTLEGTKCGDEKLCLNRRCVSLDALLKKTTRCPNNCSGHGFCNNVGKCHCFDPWAGVSCNEKLPGKPTSKTTEAIKTMLSITMKPLTDKTEIATTGISIPADTMGLVDAKVVYSVVSVILFALAVVLVVTLCYYKKCFQYRKFVLQKKSKKAKFSPKTKVIIIE